MVEVLFAFSAGVENNKSLSSMFDELGVISKNSKYELMDHSMP